MDDLVKQRLVGAVVLALIAVVLVPWMLGSPKDPRMTIQPSFSGTPVPDSKTSGVEIALVRSESTQTAASMPEATPRRLLSDPVARVTPSPKPVASATPTIKSESWLLQLASYSDRAAADDFRTRLSKDGYVSYREQVTVSGKTYYRVRLKVNGSKVQAETVKKTIENKYRLQAKLLPAR